MEHRELHTQEKVEQEEVEFRYLIYEKKQNQISKQTRWLGNVRSHIRFRPRSSTILA